MERPLLKVLYTGGMHPARTEEMGNWKQIFACNYEDF